jgi:Galactose oxidase, central domain
MPMRPRRRVISLLACLLAAANAVNEARAGTWVRLLRDAPGNVNQMLLLSDGTVMVANNYDLATTTPGSAWYRLTPDATGSYVNGTWSALASMQDTRLYYSSMVLKDGRVFVAGGEFGTGGSKSEIYDPVTNTWTANPIPASLASTATNFMRDSPAEILENGNVILMPVVPRTTGVPLVYNPTTNTWSNGPRLFRGSTQNESTWVKLPDDSILTIDPFGTNSERYIPASNSWINDGVVPVSLYDPYGLELGGAALLPNGKAFFLGSTGHTALYTPTGTTAPGTWTAGPDIPAAQGTPDAPLAILPTGRVLCAVSPVPTSADHFPSPTRFYEYDWLTNAFIAQSAPNGATDNIPCYGANMLVLPDGSVLYTHFGPDVYIYRPDGQPLAAGKPTILSVSPNSDGSFHLTGRGLNGISEGASYGDDFQMNTNYPLVRLSNGDGTVRYARTYNWSSTGVMTGSRVVSTEFRLPAGLPQGSTWSIVAVANGIASDPFCLTPPAFTQNPLGGMVCEGGTIGLAASTAAYGATTYAWEISHPASPSTWRPIVAGTNLGPGGAAAFVASGVSGNTLDLTAAPDMLAAWQATSARVRCLATNACGTATSLATTITIDACRPCPADFNGDGGVDGADVEAFFIAFEAGDAAADTNGDGGVDGSDVEAFFLPWQAGGC